MQRIVLPVERGATPSSGGSSAARPAAAPASPGTRPRTGVPAPQKILLPQEKPLPAGGPLQKQKKSVRPKKKSPPTPVPKAPPSVPVQRTPLPGSALDQAQHLRRVMGEGNPHMLRRDISRLFRSGPARTAKVMKNLTARKDRRLLVQTVHQAAEDLDRALKVYDHLRVRSVHNCAVAVLFAAVEGRPARLQDILEHLRQKQRHEDARRLRSATAVLAAGHTAATMDEEVAQVLQYTSYRVAAERELSRSKRQRREQAARDKAAKAPSPVTGTRDGRSTWRRLLRWVAALFRQRA
ncbi:hypothetical protein ACWCQS_23860 [Streptomyces sp. NPDC002076]